MSFRIPIVLCLLSLFIVTPVPAQEEPKAPTLSEAVTFADVMAYVQYEAGKINAVAADPKERVLLLGNVLLPASEKMLEVAGQPMEKMIAYQMRFSALAGQAAAEVQGAEARFETFFKELVAMEEFKEMEDRLRFMYLMMQKQIRGDEATEPKFEAFVRELEAKEKDEMRTMLLYTVRFFLFQSKAEKMEASPANFARFLTELKTWVSEEHLEYVSFAEIVSLGFLVAHKNNMPAEQIVRELTAHIQSLTVDAEDKEEMIETLAKALKLAPGVDPELYGKTLDDKDFDWKSFREKDKEKYVLIKFTATWCGPCKMQIPGMIEAYGKYKDKGLEIVSVYMWEHGDDPVAAVKKMVEEEKLPWIILSEALTEKAGQPAYGDFYAIDGVPTFVLADKEGKVIMPASHGEEWKEKLKEIFE